MNKLKKMLVIFAAFTGLLLAQDETDNLAVGQKITLAATSDGNPAPAFQWFKDGAAIAGAINTQLILPALQNSDAGIYTVSATNDLGSANSNAVTINVLVGAAPSFSTQPISQTVVTQTDVKFISQADGNPAPTYQWFKNSTAMNGQTNAILDLSFVTSNDTSNYYVTATNTFGTAQSDTASLTVNDLPPPPTLPIINNQPIDVTAIINFPFSLVIDAKGSPTDGALNFQWNKNGASILGATNSVFVVPNSSKSDVGQYNVTVSNNVGSVVSSTVNVNVVYAPTITTQPQPHLAMVNSSTTFTVEADGNPVPTYQWFRDATLLQNATKPILTIASVQPTSLGNYTVSVSNGLGAVKSTPALLDVGQYPTIITAPSSVVAPMKSKVTFAVVAKGIPAPTFQWQKNGQNLAGATGPTLTLNSLNSVTPSSAGTYKVLITNKYGTATASATLTVSH